MGVGGSYSCGVATLLVLHTGEKTSKWLSSDPGL